MLFIGGPMIKVWRTRSTQRPLWKRYIPPYPLWWKGNPQLRVLLPLFWMRPLKSKANMPPETVLFEVHPQMTVYDVKNYLEKIYKIPVMSVRAKSVAGEARSDPEYGYSIQPESDKRYAYVRLGEGQTFEFPDLFKGKTSEAEKNAKDFVRIKEEFQKDQVKNWSKADIPQWFS